MVDTTNKQTDHRQTTYKCYPIVPGGKSARDKKFLPLLITLRYEWSVATAGVEVAR